MTDAKDKRFISIIPGRDDYPQDMVLPKPCHHCKKTIVMKDLYLDYGMYFHEACAEKLMREAQ